MVRCYDHRPEQPFLYLGDYVLKWFKHISDSLDDPFIFNLLEMFGGDGYLVFFGVLEIYSREFKPEPGWKLNVSRGYLRQKLHKRQDTIIIKCLNYIGTHGKLDTNSHETPGELTANSQQTRSKLVVNSEKVNQNSGKWEVAFEGEQVIIFIPKFIQVMDNWSKRNLCSGSVVAPKNRNTEVEVDKEKKKKSNNKNQGEVFQYPDWLNLELWNDYLQHRKEQKKPLKNKSISLAVKKLRKLMDAGHDQAEIIEQSIASGWLGLFPVKDVKNSITGELKPTTYAQAQDAERRNRANRLAQEILDDRNKNDEEGNRKVINLLPSSEKN